MLPCGIPFSWLWNSEKVDLTPWDYKENCLGSLVVFLQGQVCVDPSKCHTLMLNHMPFLKQKDYSQVLLFIKASLIKVSRWTRWSIVPLFLWNPDWRFAISPFDSRNHISLLLIICSIVLHRQLLRIVGQQLSGFVLSFQFFGMWMTVVDLHVSGNLLNIHILL